MAALGPEVWVSDAPPAESGIVMLGSPIGSLEFVLAWCSVRAAVTHRLAARFPLLTSAQCRWLLLRYSAEPRVNRALRTLPPLLSFPLAVDDVVTLWQSLLALLDFAPAPGGEDLPWYIAVTRQQDGGFWPAVRSAPAGSSVLGVAGGRVAAPSRSLPGVGSAHPCGA